MKTTCARCMNDISAGARFCPRCGLALSNPPAGDTEFRAWRRRVHKRQTVFCGIAIFAGLLFVGNNTGATLIVSGLGLLGFLIGISRLARRATN